MEQSRTYRFVIADHNVAITCLEADIDVRKTVPSMLPFECGETAGELLFHLVIDNSMQTDGDYREIGDFDTGNGHIKVDKRDDTGEYLFLIRNIEEKPVAMMHANAEFTDCRCSLCCEGGMQQFALNNALMLAYAFASAKHHTLLIHASCVKQGDYAYAFIAKSGTGKSTQVGNWLKYIDNTELLNDDNPIVRVIDGKSIIYGSPWSGKTPCYRNIKAKLGAVTRIVRDKTNFVVKESPVSAFASLLPSCSTMKWDTTIYNHVLDTVSAIVANTGIYQLHCLPDRESAEVCSRTITADHNALQ